MANSLRPLRGSIVGCRCPALSALRDATGESAQLYRRQGDQRICVAAAERMSGLRDSVPVGAALTMALDLQLKFCLLGKMPTNCTEHYPVQD